MNRVITYPVPKGASVIEDYIVRVREINGEWKEIKTYKVKVDMHKVREASMAYFDFKGEAECQIECLKAEPKEVLIRPLSKEVKGSINGNCITFFLSNPMNLSIEVNGDRFHNLHLFAGDIIESDFDLSSPKVLALHGDKDGVITHSMEEITKQLEEMGHGAILYFGPGVHNMEPKTCHLPSYSRVYIDGGAVVMGSFIARDSQYVIIEGRGVIYLGNMAKTTYLRGIELIYAKHVSVSGVTIINPAHYSILMGSCYDVTIDNVKTFSCEGWSDGFDMMGCSNVRVRNSFLRNSDDCIAIYGQRGEFKGDAHNIQVLDSVLWADVAHPINIGTHGDSWNHGNIISDLLFSNIDILEQHELQDDYLGCMAINPGDKNTVKDVVFDNIRIEQFERGKLFDLQVKHNEKYNPAPGNKIENITFSNITYNGEGEFPSHINGFDSVKTVENIKFINLKINGKHILSAKEGNIQIGEYTKNITFQ